MSDAPDPGSMRLFDSAKPDLPAGKYRIASELRIKNLRGQRPDEEVDPPPAHTMHYRVTAPRFALPPRAIESCHPIPGALGAFGTRLPHVVLGRRTLPWERRIEPGQDEPWLALIVARETEASFATGSLSTMLPAAAVAGLDALEPLIGADPEVTVLQLRDDVLLPRRAELGLLSHVREVNRSDSALLKGDDDGWVAVVTSPRLPDAESDAGTKYLACLVSLEGRSDLWLRAPGAPAPALVVLHSWAFTSAAAGGTFEFFARRLDVAAFGGADGGRVGVDRVDRSGQLQPVSYRGPLTAAAPGVDQSDISLSAASELGRLLGAADTRFLRELARWHDNDEKHARAALVRRELATAMPASVSGAGPAKAALPAAIGGMLQELGGRPANLWRARTVEPPRSYRAQARQSPPAPARSMRTTGKRRSQGSILLESRMHALRSAPMRGLATHAVQQPDLLGLPDYVVQVLARMRLLHDVPFRYLVADVRLLPLESIRFFTLADDWVEALAAGALAAFGSGSREAARVRRAVPLARHVAAAQRGQVRGAKRAHARARLTADATVSGFLLRSELVGGWPGLTVRGFASDDLADIPLRADPVAIEASRPELVVPLLRIERLSPSVLFALFAGSPRLIWLEEPYQDVQYGFASSDPPLTLQVRDEHTGTTDLMLTVPMRESGGARIVDMLQLAASLDAARPMQAARGAAALALQLMRAPIRQRFAASTSLVDP